jgi:hypothetical protein
MRQIEVICIKGGLENLPLAANYVSLREGGVNNVGRYM